MQLKGKAAIVTGAGTGVGRATALALAQQGCSVIVNYSRSRDAAESTAREAVALGVKAIAFQADVADDRACRALVEVAERELGRLDVLVNNAGTTRFIPHAELERVGDADWDQILGRQPEGAVPVRARGAAGARTLGRRLDRERHERRRPDRHRQLDSVLRIEGGAQQPDDRAGAGARAADSRERGGAGIHRGGVAGPGARRRLRADQGGHRGAAPPCTACARRRTSRRRS